MRKLGIMALLVLALSSAAQANQFGLRVTTLFFQTIGFEAQYVANDLFGPNIDLRVFAGTLSFPDGLGGFFTAGTASVAGVLRIPFDQTGNNYGFIGLGGGIYFATNIVAIIIGRLGLEFYISPIFSWFTDVDLVYPIGISGATAIPSFGLGILWRFDARSQ